MLCLYWYFFDSEIEHWMLTLYYLWEKVSPNKLIMQASFVTVILPNSSSSSVSEIQRLIYQGHSQRGTPSTSNYFTFEAQFRNNLLLKFCPIGSLLRKLWFRSFLLRKHLLFFKQFFFIYIFPWNSCYFKSSGICCTSMEMKHQKVIQALLDRHQSDFNTCAVWVIVQLGTHCLNTVSVCSPPWPGIWRASSWPGLVKVPRRARVATSHPRWSSTPSSSPKSTRCSSRLVHPFNQCAWPFVGCLGQPTVAVSTDSGAKCLSSFKPTPAPHIFVNCELCVLRGAGRHWLLFSQAPPSLAVSPASVSPASLQTWPHPGHRA